MKYAIISLLLVGGAISLSITEASAAVACARGVYRAGCVGTVGAGAGTVVVRRPVVVHRRVIR
jgi:hypothetical protein